MLAFFDISFIIEVREENLPDETQWFKESGMLPVVAERG